MSNVRYIDKELSRADWLKMGSKFDRQEWARTSPLGWILEYQPLIRLEGKGDFAFEPYWSQQNWIQDDSRFRLMNKTRQSGYTTSAGSGEIPHAMLYEQNASILVISKSEGEAENIMEKFQLAYMSVKDREPNWSKPVKWNKTTVVLENGNKLKVLTSGKGSGRSYTGTHIYMDEAAFIQYVRQIFEGSFPAINRSGGRYTVFSTPEAGTKFEEMCDQHEDMGFSYHEYAWWFVPEYNTYYKEFLESYLRGDNKPVWSEFVNKARTSDWYRRTFNALGEQSFMKEYECSFNASVDKVFTQYQLNNVFVPNYLTQDFEAYGDLYTLKDPFKGYTDHTILCDYGRKRDPTIIIVVAWSIADDKWKLIEYRRIRPAIFQWGKVLETWHETYNRYNQPDAWHDGTGSGDALSLELAGYSSPIMISDTVNSRIKTNAIVNMTRAFDNEAIILPKIEQLYNEFKKYKWQDKGLVQDSVMAVMMFLMKQYTPSDSFVGVDSDFSFVGAL